MFKSIKPFWQITLEKYKLLKFSQEIVGKLGRSIIPESRKDFTELSWWLNGITAESYLTHKAETHYALGSPPLLPGQRQGVGGLGRLELANIPSLFAPLLCGSRARVGFHARPRWGAAWKSQIAVLLGDCTWVYAYPMDTGNAGGGVKTWGVGGKWENLSYHQQSWALDS